MGHAGVGGHTRVRGHGQGQGSRRGLSLTRVRESDRGGQVLAVLREDLEFGHVTAGERREGAAPPPGVGLGSWGVAGVRRRAGPEVGGADGS